MNVLRHRERWRAPAAGLAMLLGLGGCALGAEDATPVPDTITTTTAAAPNKTTTTRKPTTTTTETPKDMNDPYRNVRKVFALSTTLSTTTTSTPDISPGTSLAPPAETTTTTTPEDPAIAQQISQILMESPPPPVFGVVTVAATDQAKEEADDRSCMSSFGVAQEGNTVRVRPATTGSISAIEDLKKVGERSVHADTDLRTRGGDMQLEAKVDDPESVRNISVDIFNTSKYFCHLYLTEVLSRWPEEAETP